MHKKWWHERVFYQIYPRSFLDTNGDGIGDLPGITKKLPYLKELGIGALWLSPVYASPNYDNGYDISDYQSIHPEYGTMADMKELIKVAQQLDIKIVMDLVINHTSFEHKWFKESKNPDSPYHSYYFWRKGRVSHSGKRRPPNNWQSMFTGTSWTYEPSNDMYYLHLFTREQPDLNYDNPAVLAEVKNIMRFWLDLGVSGFRCDVINCISKQSLANGRQRVYKTGKEHYLNSPGCHLILKELHRDVLGPYEAYTVGETMDIGILDAKEYLDNELTQVFAFDQVQIDYRGLPLFKKKYKPKNMIKALKKWQDQIDWNTLFYENHDIPRSISRFGDEQNHFRSGSALAASILFLKGTPYIYEGQEIGMTNTAFGHVDNLEDISSRNVYKLLRKLFIPKRLAWKWVNNFTRDHGRTPMQWDETKEAGFTSGKPWLMVNPNYREINVARQEKDPKSLLSHYKLMIKVRQSSKTLINGDLIFLKSHKNILAVDRKSTEGTYRVLINLGKKKAKHKLNIDGEIVYANYDEFFDNEDILRPFEVLVLKR